MSQTTVKTSGDQHSCENAQCKAVVCIYLYIHTIMNTIILQLVAMYNLQLHVVVYYVAVHRRCTMSEGTKVSINIGGGE